MADWISRSPGPSGRLFLLASACLMVGGCDQDPPTSDVPTAAAAAPDERIECRIGSARQFERFCSFDLADSPDGRVIALRKPDGGFRRLLVTRDGRGVVAADGAEPARLVILDANRIEVSIGEDSFRLPARVQGR